MIELTTPYSVPTLRPCERIEPEPDETIRVGLQQRYSALTEQLPLNGFNGMTVDNHGEVLLASRLRALLPWMEPAIEVVERQVRLALWAGRPWLALPPLCLVGDPGCGKSHFARELARLSGLSAAAVDLGAMYDGAALTAVSRGWTNTKPCWPAQMMAAFRTANPLLVLDEIEKAGGSRGNGEPHKAILGMLEPSTAARYFDTCLMAEVDLSAVCWIATANSVELLPRPLLSRMEVITVGGPEPEHFDIALRGLLSGFAAKWELPDGLLSELPAPAIRVLRASFARHRSVRLLKRHLERVIAAVLPRARGDPH